LTFEYPANVRFECNGCGLCCGDTKTKKRHILLLEAELAAISAETSMPMQEFSESTEGKKPYVAEMRKTSEGKCVFLKANRCTVYGVRPLICRFYPFELKFRGGKEKHVFRFTLECPAIGKGKKITKADFERLFTLARERLG
jgi:Fe-S-cluster containining protein